MSPKQIKITPEGTTGAMTEPNRIYTEALSPQDIFDIESYAYSLGNKSSGLVTQWLLEKLEVIRRCKDIPKAEERAAIRNPEFVPWSDLSEEDRQRYRSQRGGGDFTPTREGDFTSEDFTSTDS